MTDPRVHDGAIWMFTMGGIPHAKERDRRIDRLKAACQRTVVEDAQPALATVIAAACGEASDWALRLDEDRKSVV
jgi:hypothetical protein